MLETFTSPGFLAFLGVLSGFCAALAKSLGKVFAYIDARAQKLLSEEKEARIKLEKLLTERITQLEGQVENLVRLNTLYLRRVYQLEAILVEKKIALPSLPGWPPQ